jgi:hypothetical protein
MYAVAQKPLNLASLLLNAFFIFFIIRFTIGLFTFTFMIVMMLFRRSSLMNWYFLDIFWLLLYKLYFLFQSFKVALSPCFDVSRTWFAWGTKIVGATPFLLLFLLYMWSPILWFYRLFNIKTIVGYLYLFTQNNCQVTRSGHFWKTTLHSPRVAIASSSSESGLTSFRTFFELTLHYLFYLWYWLIAN